MQTLVPQVLERARPRNERMAGDKIECNACPVLCQISAGRSGACDRYANHDGTLVRVDPVLLLRKTLAALRATCPRRRVARGASTSWEP